MSEIATRNERKTMKLGLEYLSLSNCGQLRRALDSLSCWSAEFEISANSFNPMQRIRSEESGNTFAMSHAQCSVLVIGPY